MNEKEVGMLYRMHGKDEKCVHSFNCEHLIGRDRQGYLGMDKIILKRTLKKTLLWGCGLDLTGSEQDCLVHSYGHDSEPLGSAIAGDFITGWQLLSY